MRVIVPKWFSLFVAIVVFTSFAFLKARDSANGENDNSNGSENVFLEMRSSDLQNIRYMLEPGCNQNHYHSNDTILLVTSRSSNFHLRDAQRRAYPDKYLRKHFGMRRIFLLAYDPLVTYELLTKESTEFDDILMGDFREDYLNLSLKHIMGLQWASSSCNRKRTTLVIKMDDDIAIDFSQFLEKIDTSLDSSLFGMRHYELEILKRGKWSKERRKYNGLQNENTYPDFLSGWAYGGTLQTIDNILRAAFDEEIFWIDDVWITGILSKKVGIQLVSLNPYFTVYPDHISCCNSDKPQVKCNFFVGPTGDDPEMIVKFGTRARYCHKNMKCWKRSFLKPHKCLVKNPMLLEDTKVIGEAIPS